MRFDVSSRLKRIAAFAAICVLSGCSEEAVDSPPNILLIIADDMGYTDIGSFGSDIRTPNLDSLAYSGVRFTNMHGAPTCAPARSMLISGVDHHQAGLGTQRVIVPTYDNDPEVNFVRGKPGYEGHLNTRVLTLPELMRDAGYHTYFVGKWHLGDTPEQRAFARGFESSFALPQGAAAHFGSQIRSETYRENGAIVETLPENFYSTLAFTDKAIDFIRQNENDGSPWFAQLAYTAPHWPLHVLDDWLDRYAGVFDEGYEVRREAQIQRAIEAGILTADQTGLPYVSTAPAWDSLSSEEQAISARSMEVYAAILEYMDEQIGRLLDYLRETEQLENTLIIFTSDNGAASATYEEFPNPPRDADNSLESIGRRASYWGYGAGWAESGSAPHRLYKMHVTEGGTRVAAFASGAGVEGGGRTDSTYLTFIDFLPTILDAIGAEVPTDSYRSRTIETPSGFSFVPILRAEAPDSRFQLRANGWEYNDKRSLVRDHWMIWRSPEVTGREDWQLFDLSTDPGQRRNLSAQHPELVDELVSAWYEWADASGVIVLDGFDD